MPLNAAGWTTEEDEKLIELVEPYKHLYLWLDHSRKNILSRENTWEEIAKELCKPVEEIKKRWRCLRDSYTRNKRMGTIHKSKVPIFEKLQFLSAMPLDTLETIVPDDGEQILEIDGQINDMHEIGHDPKVIMDGQEYYEHDYEISLVDPQREIDIKPRILKIVPNKVKLNETNGELEQPPKKIGRKNAGRKKSVPLPRNIPPVRILPKPIIVSDPSRIIKCVDDRKGPEERSQVIDKLIEKMLKENTNEIDVFFRSMAASVKKLQPNLIPKVKLEVCNVIAKYELQSFEKNLQNI